MPSFPLKFTAFTAAVIRLLPHAAVISDFLVFCFWFAALALACFRFIPRKTFIRFTQPAAQPRCGKLIFPSQSVVYGVFVCVCVWGKRESWFFSLKRVNTSRSGRLQVIEKVVWCSGTGIELPLGRKWTRKSRWWGRFVHCEISCNKIGSQRNWIIVPAKKRFNR